jgi:hypothetical protein
MKTETVVTALGLGRVLLHAAPTAAATLYV